MPTSQEHLAQARRNEEFLVTIRALPVRYAEWETVALFYSALHYVDAFLATLGEHPRNHRIRIARVNSATALQHEYQDLFDASMEARYEALTPTTARADHLMVGPFLRVKEEMLSLLGI